VMCSTQFISITAEFVKTQRQFFGASLTGQAFRERNCIGRRAE
jgi:hypothetical protein